MSLPSTALLAMRIMTLDKYDLVLLAASTMIFVMFVDESKK